MSGGRLVVLDRAGREVKHFTLSSGVATLGSDPACDIRVLLPTVDPHHATLVVHANQTLIRNVGSGETFVNGVSVSVAPLRHDDVVSLGERELRWRYTRPAPQHVRRRPDPPGNVDSAAARASREGQGGAAARRSEPTPAPAHPPPQRDSMPAAVNTRQVAIVQPQRRDTADHIETVSSPTVTMVTNIRRSRTNKSEAELDVSIDKSEEHKSKPKSPKIPQMNLQNTTKATLWIESRKSSPRKSVKESPSRMEITPRKVVSAKKSTPLRMTVLKKAQSAHKLRVTKIEAPLTVDHTKQAAIMLMTGHTPKQKGASPKQSSAKRASFVIKKPSPVRKTPRKSGRRSKNLSNISVASTRASTASDDNSSRSSSKISLDYSASVMEITDSETQQSSLRGSDIATRSGAKSALRSPLLPSAKKSALKDPLAKRSTRKTESIKFDFSNLENSVSNSQDVLTVTDTTNKSSYDDEISEDELTLHYSDSSTTKSPSPRKDTQSRSSKILERTLGTSFTANTEPAHTTLAPESPRARKSLRGSIMLQKVLQTPTDNTTMYSRRSTKSLSDRSWDATVASARRTRTLSPQTAKNMESYSIVDLVSIDSNDSHSMSVYNSASSTDTTASKFGTPQTSAGRKTRSIRGRSLLASSTPAVKSNYRSRVSMSQSAATSRSYDSIPDNYSARNSVVSTRRSKSLSTPEHTQGNATFNISGQAKKSSSGLELDNTEEITINSTRKSRQSKSFSSPVNVNENATFYNTTRKSQSSPANTEDVIFNSTRNSRKSKSASVLEHLQDEITLDSSRTSRKSASISTSDNSLYNILKDSSRKSRKSNSISTPENSQDSITLNSTRKSRISKLSRLRVSEINIASFTDKKNTPPRPSMRSINSTPNDSPSQSKGMSTPENQKSPQEVGTPMLSIQSLLDSSLNSTKSRLSKRETGNIPVNVTRKTIGSRLSMPRKRVSMKSKSFSLGTRSLRRSRNLMNNSASISDNMSEDLYQDDGETTPKSAVKLVQEAVKNKHSTAKKPHSKRSIIDNLNESDIVKQLFNSPVKRKLSQSMIEFSRKQLLEDDTTPPKRATRNTIALTGRTPDNSVLEHSQAFTPEVFVSPLSTPSNSPNVSGLKRLFAKSTPENDLRNVKGVKKLLQTPRNRRSVKNDLTKVSGVKALFARSPRNRLSDVRVKEVFAVSPNNDLRRVSGVKSLFHTRNKNKSPKNDLEDVAGVRNIFKKNSPSNDLSNVSGVKTTLRRNSPKNDLSDVRGLRRLFRQEKQREDMTDISGIEELFSESHQASNLTDTNAESSFDLLIGKPHVRAYPKAKSFSTKLIQKPKARKAKSLHTSFTLITNNVEDWLENELRKRMHREDISEPSAKKSSEDNVLASTSKTSKSVGSISLSKGNKSKEITRNKSLLSTSATKGRKSVNNSQDKIVEGSVPMINKSANNSYDAVSKDSTSKTIPVRKSKSDTEETPTMGLNKSKNKTGISRELRKLATDTVEGNTPVLTPRIRNSTVTKLSLVESGERQKSTSEIYGAHMLPIKKRSLVDISANRSSEKNTLPIKKRAVMHSTPVKGRINLTMNASDIGRVSPIALYDETRDVNTDNNQESIIRPMKLLKNSPKRKPIETRKNKIVPPVKDDEIAPEHTQYSPRNKEKPQNSPGQVRATRGRKTKENFETNNIKKRKSSIVITKKSPVLTPKPAAKVPRQEPDSLSVENTESTIKRTRRNINQKPDLVEGGTESQQTNKVIQNRKLGSKSNVVKAVSQEEGSPPKTRTTRRQKATVDKVQTPKKTARAKVLKASVVITRPSPQMNPRSVKQNKGNESEKTPEKKMQRTRKTMAEGGKLLKDSREKSASSKESHIDLASLKDKENVEGGLKIRGRKGKRDSSTDKTVKKGRNVANNSNPKEKETEEVAETNPKQKRGRKTIAKNVTQFENSAIEVQTRSSRNTVKETVTTTSRTRGKTTASQESTQAAPKRQVRSKNTQTVTAVAENIGRGRKRKITIEEGSTKLRKINIDDDSSKSNIEGKIQKATSSEAVAAKGRRGKKNMEALEVSKNKTVEEEVVESKRGRYGKKTEKESLKASQPNDLVARKKGINAKSDIVEPKSTRGRKIKKQSVEAGQEKSIEVTEEVKKRTRKGAEETAQKSKAAKEIQETKRGKKSQKSAAQETEVKTTRRKKAVEPEIPPATERKRKTNTDASAAKEPSKSPKKARKPTAVSPKVPARETRTRANKLEETRRPAARSRRR